MHRRAFHLLVAAVLALAMTSLPAPVQVSAVTPTPAEPMRVRFEAGSHTGYAFNLATGAITGSKVATLSRPSGAATTRRALIPGRGVHLLIANGIWAGYWIRESIVAHVEGIVGQTPYTTPRRVAFPAGNVIGYRFDGAWALTSAKVLPISRTSGADAAQAASINGVVYYQIVNGGLAGTWVPAGATGAVRPLACHTGPRATGGAEIYRQVAGADREVALTFDLGGRTDPALAIARRLLLLGACSTIFPTGDAALSTAGNAVLEFMDDYPQVFEMGNHTKDHCDLVNGGGDTGCPLARQPASFTQSQLTAAAAIIKDVTGQSPIPYWRPPYGTHDAAVRAAAAGVGYTKTVMWDLDTIDWKPPPPVDTGPTTVQIIGKVRAGTDDGSIVLMHLGGWNTHDALPRMVLDLRLRGMQPTSISDLADGQ